MPRSQKERKIKETDYFETDSLAAQNSHKRLAEQRILTRNGMQHCDNFRASYSTKCIGLLSAMQPNSLIMMTDQASISIKTNSIEVWSR